MGKLHNSPAVAPAEVLLSLVFDGFHDNIKFIMVYMFLPEVIKEKAIAR